MQSLNNVSGYKAIQWYFMLRYFSGELVYNVVIKFLDENSTNPMLRSYEAERLVSENLILLEEDWKGGAGRGSSVISRGRRSSSITPRGTPEPSDDSPVYFRYMHKKFL